ncbi:hypothetical protein HMN09_00225600 [Mycena chlorophos]|uniref:NADH dehydrogenase [ubiquinone] 1 alpha subcomplex subunit n=1 Tax=Mycena chlorophos TaxID=658473 RepID=A0A8H6THN6_MYCCL|nr:hypothetical protein HMN09_00225600 [Mycena chlorophos]
MGSLLRALVNRFRGRGFLVGRDFEGNRFYEHPSLVDDPRPRRSVKYRTSDDMYKYIGGQRRLAVQWSAWLTHTRRDPPTLEASHLANYKPTSSDKTGCATTSLFLTHAIGRRTSSVLPNPVQHLNPKSSRPHLRALSQHPCYPRHNDHPLLIRLLDNLTRGCLRLEAAFTPPIIRHLACSLSLIGIGAGASSYSMKSDARFLDGGYPTNSRLDSTMIQ